MNPVQSAAGEVIARCRTLAAVTEESGYTTRTFLSQAAREVQVRMSAWMEQAGMCVWTDPAGNLHGAYPAVTEGRPVLYIGSHLDTVPRAGAFDGILGVMLGIALIQALEGRKLGFRIEMVGFSEEEGVRFSLPFIGSRAFTGTLDAQTLERSDPGGVTVAEAIRRFGLDPGRMQEAEADPNAIGYLEMHIEQGPVLESLGVPLGVVQSIVGQTRIRARFEGRANHAGTTPMTLRQDALTGAAEWILSVERLAIATEGLVATNGKLQVEPGAGNVIAGACDVSLDVRHASDRARNGAVASLLACARDMANRRKLRFSHEVTLEQPAVPMDEALAARVEAAVRATGLPVHRMNSGAGHDAMVVAARMPAAMLFVRSPGGISHHPGESVLESDVAAALQAGIEFLELTEAVHHV